MKRRRIVSVGGHEVVAPSVNFNVVGNDVTVNSVRVATIDDIVPVNPTTISSAPVVPVLNTGALTSLFSPLRTIPTNTITVEFMKIGRLVHCFIPMWMATASGSPTQFTLPGIVPVGYRPSSPDQLFCRFRYMLWNSSLPLAEDQAVHVGENGDITFIGPTSSSFISQFGPLTTLTFQWFTA